MDWYVVPIQPPLYYEINLISVIILIAAEILVAAVNIVVDLYAGVD